MRREDQRVVIACRVELTGLDDGVSQDLGRHGIFVRTRQFLPVGAEVELRIHLARGSMALMMARVSHVLSETAARSLGREAGMGFEFVEQDQNRLARFGAIYDELSRSLTHTPASVLPRRARVVVADSSARLLERVSRALQNAGFVVEPVTDGGEAYVACLREPPEILLADAGMERVDGWTLIKMLGNRPHLANIPVVLMSEDGSDLVRLRAYRSGVRDFIPKPFTVVELCIRLRRLARTQRTASESVVLRGSLGEIGLGTLLSLFEYERKSGQLVVSHEEDVTWISVRDGAVVKVEGSDSSASSRENLMRVLDRQEGEFEFTACTVDDGDELGVSTTHLLLEHARLFDERSKG